MGNLRYCLQCVSHVKIDAPRKNRSEHECGHDEIADLVTGERIECEVARRNARLCGREGRLFAPAVG